MKEQNYNIEKYPFKILLEDLLECKLEKIHEKFKVGSEEIVGKVYEYFRTSKDFKLIWESFCEDVGDAIYEEIPFIDVEIKKNSPTHDRVGQIVCKEWGLNRDVESVIRWHHEVDIIERGTVGEDELNNLIDVVYVGNWLAHSLHFGFSGHRSHGKLSPEIMERLSLDDEQLDYFKQETRENFKECRNFLNLIERTLG